MEIEKVLGLIVLGWLIGAVLLMARLVRRARALMSLLATQYPGTYEALGRPQPGFLQSARRSAFTQFMLRRAYEDLEDPALSPQFEEYRHAEFRALVSLVVSLVIVALLVVTVRYAA